VVVNANQKENEMFTSTLTKISPRLAAAVLSATTLSILHFAPLAEAGYRGP